MAFSFFHSHPSAYRAVGVRAFRPALQALNVVRLTKRVCFAEQLAQARNHLRRGVKTLAKGFPLFGGKPELVLIDDDSTVGKLSFMLDCLSWAAHSVSIIPQSVHIVRRLKPCHSGGYNKA